MEEEHQEGKVWITIKSSSPYSQNWFHLGWATGKFAHLWQLSLTLTFWMIYILVPIILGRPFILDVLLYQPIHRYVCIAMEALDQLLMACHCQSINLFVESFLKMVAKLLESEKPDLQILGTNSVSISLGHGLEETNNDIPRILR